MDNLPYSMGNMSIRKVNIPQESDIPQGSGKVSNLKNDLGSLFGSITRALVIWTLLNQPDDGLTQADFAHLTNSDPKDVRRALDILEQLNLAWVLTSYGGVTSIEGAKNLDLERVMHTTRGTRRYRLNKEHPWVPGLKIILESSYLGGISLLRKGLSAFPVDKIKPDAAFVFGSFANGSQTPESDIDLIVIGYHDRPTLAELIDKLEQQTGRKIDYFEYTSDEWAKALQDGDYFVNSVMKKPKVFLVGDNERLEQIIGERTGR
jgi:predicted nucleotidyltransferase